MHNRIKELAEQAVISTDDTFNTDPAEYDKPGQQKVWQEMMQSRFSESIIQECTKILEDLGTEYINAGHAQAIDNSSQHKALAIAKARIIAHFRE